jgi:hypothetical protein
MRSASLPLVVLGALAGCAGEPPTIVRSDGTFVTVTQPEHTRQSATKEVADGYCQEHGKRATFLSDVCPDPTCAQKELTFWCK